MGNIDIVEALLRFALLVPAIVFHEVAHGYAALALGDTTAKNAGRLTLNPLKHIDLWGTVLLPLLMTVTFGFGFGYAKPVPVNPWRFRDRRRGMFLTGMAGPASNFAMAALAGVVVRIASLIGGPVAGWVGAIAFAFALMNLALMFFNLIPLPPLDGSRVLPLFLPDSAMAGYHQIERYGFVILFAVLWLAPGALSAYFRFTVLPVLRLLTGVS